VAIDPSTGKAYKDTLEKDRLFTDVVGELYTKTEGWLQPDSGAGAFKTHGTGSTGGNGAGAIFSHDKAIEAAKASGYPSSDPRFMEIITNAQIAAAKGV